jgi:hypothetical protein
MVPWFKTPARGLGGRAATVVADGVSCLDGLSEHPAYAEFGAWLASTDRRWFGSFLPDDQRPAREFFQASFNPYPTAAAGRRKASAVHRGGNCRGDTFGGVAPPASCLNRQPSAAHLLREVAVS